MCANILHLTYQWNSWCNMPSGRGTSVVDVNRNKKMKRTDEPRPVGYVAQFDQRRENT